MDHLERAKELLETCEKSYNSGSGWVMVAACHALIYIAESKSERYMELPLDAEGDGEARAEHEDGGGRMSAITMDTVRDLIERHSDHISGNTREFYNGAYAEIADELNAELGSGTCECVWNEQEGTFHCSSCDTLLTDEISIEWPRYKVTPITLPNYCPDCGAKVER